jgi:hypothetical protein
MDPDGDIQAFSFFFDELVPCVAGRKVWTLREKASKLISEAKQVVSVLDEAFAILALMNYWERWISMEWQNGLTLELVAISTWVGRMLHTFTFMNYASKFVNSAKTK